MSSAICFNLDQSKILTSGNVLPLLHLVEYIVLDNLRLKAFEDGKLNMDLNHENFV